jgi:hypothetical protein
MIATLALSLVGGWTYAGLLAEPSAPPKPPDAALVSARAPAEAKTNAVKTTPVVARASVPTPTPPAPPPASTRPTLYRLADATGQTWEHADPAYLSSFVATRNASAMTYFTTPAFSAAQCATGRCR